MAGHHHGVKPGGFMAQLQLQDLVNRLQGLAAAPDPSRWLCGSLANLRRS
jgi:hypothetical protein